MPFSSPRFLRQLVEKVEKVVATDQDRATAVDAHFQTLLHDLTTGGRRVGQSGGGAGEITDIK